MKKVDPPVLGQLFSDKSGTYWLVKDVIVSSGSHLSDFFLARLNHGRTPECLDGSLMLAPTEYQAFLQSRQLTLLHANDVGRRNPAGENDADYDQGQDGTKRFKRD